MRDRDVDKPREKIASSRVVASFSSRIWFAPPPDPPFDRETYNFTFSFPSPVSISFKTPPRRRNVYQLAPPIFLHSFSLSLSSFFRPPSVSLPPPGGTNYRPVSHEAAKSISAYT